MVVFLYGDHSFTSLKTAPMTLWHFRKHPWTWHGIHKPVYKTSFTPLWEIKKLKIHKHRKHLLKIINDSFHFKSYCDLHSNYLRYWMRDCVTRCLLKGSNSTSFNGHQVQIKLLIGWRICHLERLGSTPF